MNDYKTTIGIEVHAELKTDKKVFSYTKNNYGSFPNTNINEIDLGYPGTLPIFNRQVLKQALKAALAINSKINMRMHFDRKNYFYPDLPKGYQITQQNTPIGYEGYLDIEIDGKVKRIGIERIHIEEDTAKSIHVDNKTLLNYNRAGVPLVEVVSKPEISSKEEATKYLKGLREILLYLDISDCKMEEGSMRADINISLSKDEKLGTKIEIKNMNSIKDINLAIEYEILRQKKLLDSGEKLHEETRKFDKESGKTILMRRKEIGNDYRYFPEPDIPFIVLDDCDIEEARSYLKMLPNERRDIYKSKGILDINIEKIIANKDISDYLNTFIDNDINFVIASNLLLGDISSYLNDLKKNILDTKLTKSKFIDVVNMLDEGIITSKIFKDILSDIFENGDSIDIILKNKNIVLINNEDELINITQKVLDENVESVVDYKNGKDRALKFLMGTIMKETKGKANPKKVNQILLELLSK